MNSVRWIIDPSHIGSLVKATEKCVLLRAQTLELCQEQRSPVSFCFVSMSRAETQALIVFISHLYEQHHVWASAFSPRSCRRTILCYANLQKLTNRSDREQHLSCQTQDADLLGLKSRSQGILKCPEMILESNTTHLNAFKV